MEYIGGGKIQSYQIAHLFFFVVENIRSTPLTILLESSSSLSVCCVGFFSPILLILDEENASRPIVSTFHGSRRSCSCKIATLITRQIICSMPEINTFCITVDCLKRPLRYDMWMIRHEHKECFRIYLSSFFCLISCHPPRVPSPWLCKPLPAP